MNRPSTITYLFGNMAVAGTSLIATLIGGWGWLAGFVPLSLVLAGLGVTCICSQARVKITAYRSWRAQWEALDDPAPATNTTSRTPVSLVDRILIGVMLACWLLLAIGVKTPQQKTAWIYFTIGLVVYGLVALVKRVRRRAVTRPEAATPRDDNVAICIERPLLPVPNLQDAYLQLPRYCHDVFSGQSRP